MEPTQDTNVCTNCQGAMTDGVCATCAAKTEATPTPETPAAE